MIYYLYTTLQTLYLYFHPSYCNRWVHEILRTWCCAHTQNWRHTEYMEHACSQPLISILICLSHCWFLHGFLLVSAAYIPWMRRPSTMSAKGGFEEGSTLPYCMPTSMHNFNNRPCHWNKSQSFNGSGPSYAHSNFISPQQKIEAGEINLWSIPNILPTIWAALGGLFYISMGNANNLLEMYYITSQRMTKLATAQSDENKPNRTLQFHGDTAWCNEVTVILWLPSCPSSSMPFQT